MIKTPDGQPLDAQFDWYQCSTPADLNTIREVLAPMLSLEPLQDVKPVLKGYGWSLLTGGRGGSIRIHYGGKNGDEHGPNIQGTGPLSPGVAQLLREACIPHGVGRADVRIDFLADFDTCRLKFIDRCNQAGMAASDAGSCPEAAVQLGRTVYGGAKSSFYQPTLYQKGLQLGDGHPADYLRLEHRFTPTKSHEKAQLSQLTPSQMVGCRPVARELSESIATLAIAPYKLTRYPKERTPYHWMLQQYRSTLNELFNDHGSWACVGQQIGLDLEELAHA